MCSCLFTFFLVGVLVASKVLGEYSLPLSISYIVPESRIGVKLSFPATNPFDQVKSAGFYIWIDETLDKAKAYFNKAVIDETDQLFVESFKLRNDTYEGKTQNFLIKDLPGNWMIFWIKIVLSNGTELYQEYAEYAFPDDALTHLMILKFDDNGKPVRDISADDPTDISNTGNTPVVPPIVQAKTAIPITHPVTPTLNKLSGGGERGMSRSDLILAITIPIIVVLIIIIVAIVLIMRYRQKFELVQSSLRHNAPGESYYCMPNDSGGAYIIGNTYSLTSDMQPTASDNGLVMLPLHQQVQLTPPVNRPLPKPPVSTNTSRESSVKSHRNQSPAPSVTDEETKPVTTPISPAVDNYGYIDVSSSSDTLASTGKSINPTAGEKKILSRPSIETAKD